PGELDDLLPARCAEAARPRRVALGRQRGWGPARVAAKPPWAELSSVPRPPGGRSPATGPPGLRGRRPRLPALRPPPWLAGRGPRRSRPPAPPPPTGRPPFPRRPRRSRRGRRTAPSRRRDG